MTRVIVFTIAVVFFIGIAGVLLVFRLMPQDGTPDDRLLTGMQQIAWDTQSALDETGELPRSLSDLLKLHKIPAPDGADIGISYHRLGHSSLRLCGDFQKRSLGQKIARPFNDYSLELHPDLTAPRPKSGNHCYDIDLQSTDMTVRHDALLYRDLNAAATTVECTFLATGEFPKNLADAKTLSPQKRDTPACRVREFLRTSGQSINYSMIDNATIGLCAEFKSAYSPSGELASLFDPRRDARFSEFAQKRLSPGKFCYAIKVLLPDLPAAIPEYVWDAPFDTESAPEEQRDAVIADKRAIGDIVNVLRLARCGYTMGGATPETIEGAIRTIAAHRPVARRYGCGWAPSYFAQNPPIPTYEPRDNGKVRVCAQFQKAWEQPLALGYYGRALENWPRSLAELQRPLKEPGRQCFTVQWTPIGSGLEISQ